MGAGVKVATHLQEHITIQQAMFEGAQLARPVAIMCVYVRQDTVLLLILMHNNCKEKKREEVSERKTELERVSSTA